MQHYVAHYCTIRLYFYFHWGEVRHVTWRGTISIYAAILECYRPTVLLGLIAAAVTSVSKLSHHQLVAEAATKRQYSDICRAFIGPLSVNQLL